MRPAEFAPAIPASERPQIHALDRAATGIGQYGALVKSNIPEDHRVEKITPVAPCPPEIAHGFTWEKSIHAETETMTVTTCDT
jgi:hypothetical protein